MEEPSGIQGYMGIRKGLGFAIEAMVGPFLRNSFAFKVLLRPNNARQNCTC